MHVLCKHLNTEALLRSHPAPRPTLAISKGAAYRHETISSCFAHLQLLLAKGFRQSWKCSIHIVHSPGHGRAHLAPTRALLPVTRPCKGAAENVGTDPAQSEAKEHREKQVEMYGEDDSESSAGG